MNNKKTWLPLIVATAIAFFIYLGVRLENYRIRSVASAPNDRNSLFFNKALTHPASEKLETFLDMLEAEYVDTLDLNALVEKAIPTIVEELDPHSVYIPAEDLEETNEPLAGSFSGIGVQFNIQNDTVMVISVISGGPSEKIGLMPGDRIVSINDSSFVGKDINNEKVFKSLRGEKGTTVRVGIRRSTSDTELKFDIVRGDIPVNSVVASYLTEDNIGYIKVDNFGRNTYNEFFTALLTLKRAGAKGFMVDLRGNSGGYMDICIRMVNEFLARNTLIVYTEGKTQSRENMYADGRGSFQNMPLVVLIDEWSASASEIFAGAIQDNDRGIVIGRRSFGKGLVQRQFEFADGSALRLTTARYYIPSGRCIQKTYKMGEGKDYALDLINRYTHGEFYSKDSIHMVDSLKYRTVKGRVVYGGGGIMPDVFIPSDTAHVTPYWNQVINAGLAYSFAFRYADKNRQKLSAYKDFRSLEQYLSSQALVNDFVKYAAEKVKPESEQIERSRKSMERLIISYIMRQVKDENYFYRKFFSDDPTYLEGIRILNEEKSFPE